MNDDATQFSYFRDNELTQLSNVTIDEDNSDSTKALDEGTIFLNKYRILKVLGEGSFSLIYLLEAKDASKKLLVAKEFFPKGFVTRNQNNEVILKTSLSEKEIENYHFMKEIFIGEAQNLVKVSKRTHPNVLNFFALEENVNNTMYLITDYEEGMTLKDYIKERKREYKGKLTNQEITGIATGLLNGLGHIHKVDVYHQDIKLENILIRQDQYPLLLDFGASIILYDKKQKKYFNATTPRYAAPEQVELSQPPKIDQRTDIYELGVLLYKLITDEFPPKASERLKAVEKHKDSYVPLEIQKPYGYDINVLKAVDRALELEPNNRFQNVEDFKKAILRKKSYMNFLKIGLVALIPIMIGLIYVLWPEAKGTAKLNLDQKKYFVYSDGKKTPLSEEKTILLSSGEHQLTIIKDGYIPLEVNVDIKANSIVNVSGKLAPLSHTITLFSNISQASFTVNGKDLKSNTFNGEVDNKYIIKTKALHYIPETNEVDYMTLYKNDFKFRQELKSVQTEVEIIVDRSVKVGKNNISVNGKPLNKNIMLAKYNELYKIEITNPFYKKVHIERSYEQLSKNPKQNILLERGRGEIILKGLPEGVTIDLYTKHLNTIKLLASKFIYVNNEYHSKILAFDKLYIKLSKKGYKTFETEIFSIKNNDKYIATYKLTKNKPVIKKEEEITLTSTIDVSNNLHKVANKVKINNSSKINMKQDEGKRSIDNIPNARLIKMDQNNTRNSINEVKYTPIKVVKTKKVVPKRKEIKSKKVKIVRYKIKNGDTVFSIARANHTTVKEVKKLNKLKKNELLKVGRVLEVPVDTYFRQDNKNTINKKEKISKSTTTSSYLWYCIAGAEGTQIWSAKHATKKGASESALRQCRKKRHSFCRVSSCYILDSR